MSITLAPLGEAAEDDLGVGARRRRGLDVGDRVLGAVAAVQLQLAGLAVDRVGVDGHAGGLPAQRVDEGIANPAETRRLVGAAGEDDFRVRAVGGRYRRRVRDDEQHARDEQWRSHQPDQRPFDRPLPPGAFACSEQAFAECSQFRARRTTGFDRAADRDIDGIENGSAHFGTTCGSPLGRKPVKASRDRTY